MMRLGSLMLARRMLLFTLIAANAGVAPAQSYPSRTLVIVSTAPAGGSIDAVARLIASDLARAFGLPVVVEAKPGAGGNIAAEYVAKAAPDGHTFMISSSSTLTVNPHIYKSVPFDRLNMEIVKILQAPVTKERIAAIGLEPHSSTPEELGVALRTDRERFVRVIREAGITAQ